LYNLEIIILLSVTDANPWWDIRGGFRDRKILKSTGPASKEIMRQGFSSLIDFSEVYGVNSYGSSRGSEKAVFKKKYLRNQKNS